MEDCDRVGSVIDVGDSASGIEVSHNERRVRPVEVRQREEDVPATLIENGSTVRVEAQLVEQAA